MRLRSGSKPDGMFVSELEIEFRYLMYKESLSLGASQILFSSMDIISYITTLNKTYKGAKKTAAVNTEVYLCLALVLGSMSLFPLEWSHYIQLLAFSLISPVISHFYVQRQISENNTIL